MRTNNHVERTNRMVRFLEKVRYKWRRRKTLVRFVVLKLDEIWSAWSPLGAKAAAERRKHTQRKSTSNDDLQRRQVA